jgi:hypothetical protein
MSAIYQSPATMAEQVAVGYVKQTMQAVCSHRRFLLKVVLAGKHHWMNTAMRAFKGLAVGTDTLESMWHYFVARAYHNQQTTAQLKEELGFLLEQQDEVRRLSAEAKLNDVVKLTDSGDHVEITLDLERGLDIPDALKESSSS